MTARQAALTLYSSGKLQPLLQASKAVRWKVTAAFKCTLHCENVCKQLKSRGSQEESAIQQTGLATPLAKGSKQDSTPVDKACQSPEDEQVSEDDGFNAWTLHLDSDLLTGLPQHSFVHLSQGCCSNGPL